MTTPPYQLVLIVIVLLLLLVALPVAYSSRRRRRRTERTRGVVVIQEGRFPGETGSSQTCPSCMQKFKTTAVFEGELLKCPYCGTVID